MPANQDILLELHRLNKTDTGGRTLGEVIHKVAHEERHSWSIFQLLLREICGKVAFHKREQHSGPQRTQMVGYIESF